jgi:hypothetical protein
MNARALIASVLTHRRVSQILLMTGCLVASPVAWAAPEPGLVGSVSSPSVLQPPGTPPADPIPLPNPTIVVIPPPVLRPAPLAPDPRLGAATVAAEIARLRTVLAADIPGSVTVTPAAKLRWIMLARAQLAATQTEILRPQLIVIVDRAVKVQQLALLVAQPNGPYEVIGAVHVSTGQAGRFDHYVTPTGVFRHTDAILDYRAQGTYNENHIRGLGLKGMRVWDFGWQWARKGWSPGIGKPSEIQIRLEMHATDPAVLEQRIGRTASQGCVRIPSAMNRFLDKQGVLDAGYEQAAVTDIRYRALLLRDRTGSILAGDALVIVDSSLPPGMPPDQHPDRKSASAGKGDVKMVSGKSG